GVHLAPIDRIELQQRAGLGDVTRYAELGRELPEGPAHLLEGTRPVLLGHKTLAVELARVEHQPGGHGPAPIDRVVRDDLEEAAPEQTIKIFGPLRRRRGPAPERAQARQEHTYEH